MCTVLLELDLAKLLTHLIVVTPNKRDKAANRPQNAIVANVGEVDVSLCMPDGSTVVVPQSTVLHSAMLHQDTVDASTGDEAMFTVTVES